MSKFLIPVIFSFEGNATITAESKEEAINTITEYFRARLGDVSGNNNEKIIDWDIPCGAYPEILEQQIEEL